MDPASESETCVMEKRDAGAGDTVKREKGPGAAALGDAAGAGKAASGAGVGGKPSSHANPRSARQGTVTRIADITVPLNMPAPVLTSHPPGRPHPP